MISNYINFRILLFILFFLVSVLLFFVAVSFFYRIGSRKKKRKQEAIYLLVKNWLVTNLEQKNHFEEEVKLPPFFKHVEIVISVIEDLDASRTDANWEHLKKIIGQKTLLPQARKWVGSRYRKKNHFACRCFALSSQPQDEEKIKALLNYPHISVHIQALFSAVSFMESNGCSDQLLKIIFKRLEENISRWLFAYKAVLIRGKSFIAPWIEKELEREKQPLLRTIYLDLLSLMIGDRVLTYLVDDLKSDNRNLRLTALKIVSQFPKPVDAATLIKLYSDPDPEIRRFVLQTLPSVMGEKAIHLLQESLQDSSWEICLQSALGLKSFGQTGKKILESQEKESDSFAYEASQFVLALPSEVNYVNF